MKDYGDYEDYLVFEGFLERFLRFFPNSVLSFNPSKSVIQTTKKNP
jgi:hypothetical protein